MPEFASSAGSSVACFCLFLFGGVLFRTVQSAAQDVEACWQRPLEGHGTVADFSAVQRRGSCTHFMHQRCAGEPDGGFSGRLRLCSGCKTEENDGGYYFAHIQRYISLLIPGLTAD